MSVEQVSNLLSRWEEENLAGGDVTQILVQLAELFEIETEAFLKKDPDPFDDRHPSRVQPDCTLGHMLKTIFHYEQIVDAIVREYCQEDNVELNTAACRLLLDILPGLESVLFEQEGFVPRLLHFAETAPNPLRSYATGLVAAAMEVAEIAAKFRDKNAYFVPLMLRRLDKLSGEYLKDPGSEEEVVNTNRPFAAFRKNCEKLLNSVEDDKLNHRSAKKRKRNDLLKPPEPGPVLSEVKSSTASNFKMPIIPMLDEGSNSKWNELMIGSYQVFPLTLVAEQRYILEYLTPMGEYQELIGHVFESKVLTLILRYIDIRQNPDVRLTFEALKYLAALLVHKKVAMEFLLIGGLKPLLKVPFPSIAATGVSICLYYFSYTEEVMEKICSLSPSDISDLVSYALWLLECSHDSGRCHATMFFEFSFGFKIILEQFDKQDGLRKLFNVMSTLGIFAQSDSRSLSDDQVFANRQTTRHVCGALKRYFEAHLAYEVENYSENAPLTSQNKNKAVDLSYKSVESYINAWHELSNSVSGWKPVEEFQQFEGISFILELVSDYLRASYSGGAETVKNALDILKICSLTRTVQLALCEKVNTTLSQNLGTTGITVLLAAAEGEFLQSAEVQKSALQTIINCVCTKVQNETGLIKVSKNMKRGRKAEELLSRLCENIRVSNGIMVLINLLSIRTPLTDADAIRALACKALCGLARSENVKQIISKLPIVTDGQLLDLIREEREDKNQDYVLFCKHGLELIMRVTGAPVSAESESSMLNINKYEIAAKTKVVYNDAQLMQLMWDHLVSKGFTETASCLQKEMNAKGLSMPSWMHPTSAFSTPRSGLKRFQKDPLSSTMSPLSHTPSSYCSSSPSTPSRVAIPPPSIPLKIVLTKKTATPITSSPLSSRLQKPQSCSGDFYQTPAIKKQYVSNSSHSSKPKISLDSIVTEYLRKQHSLCKTPMLACPPFDLFTHHKCPEPKKRLNAPVNSVLRLQKRQIYHQYGGIGGAALDRKCIYNKFRFVHAFHDDEGSSSFSASSFFNYQSDSHPRILIGTVGQFRSSGELQVYSVNSAELEITKNSHLRKISHIQSTHLSPLIITSSGNTSSSMWNLNDTLEIVREFSDISYLEFSKRSVHKAVGTKHDSAVIIDTSTGAEIQKFLTKDLGNNYASNRATYDYSDELILTDGLIFDCRSGKLVHKLDKFNAQMNGVFHPNGREIISNTEIWDIYTFNLLRTVSGLENCIVTFNPSGSVIYGVISSNTEDSHEKLNCFYTFDAYDYSGIATIDVKKPIFELSADFNDRFISTIESSIGIIPFNPRSLETSVRLYEIGRSKEDGDEDNEESDDSEDETEDDDDGNDVEMDEDNEGGDDDVVFELDDSERDSSSDQSDESDILFSLNTSD